MSFSRFQLRIVFWTFAGPGFSQAVEAANRNLVESTFSLQDKAGSRMPRFTSDLIENWLEAGANMSKRDVS